MNNFASLVRSHLSPPTFSQICNSFDETYPERSCTRNFNQTPARRKRTKRQLCTRCELFNTCTCNLIPHLHAEIINQHPCMDCE